MKKLISIYLLLSFAICSGIYAQEVLPLTPTLQSLQPEQVFPLTADKEYKFNDNWDGKIPNTFSVRLSDNKLQVFSAEIFTPSKSRYDVNTCWKGTSLIKKGDVMLARLSMRSIYAKQESGDAVIFFYVQKTKGERSIVAELAAGPEWKTYEIPFEATEDMKPGESEICISFGGLAQKVEVANIEVLNFGKKTTIVQLPTTRFTYDGREANAPWRDAAFERIEKIRTAAFVVQVLDKNGKAVKDANVDVKMIQSDFVWGTAIYEKLIATDLPNSANYKKYLKEFFNTAVIENGFKSPNWTNPTIQPETKRAFEWLEKEKFRQRGHNLVWPGWKFNTQSLKDLAEKDTAAFSKAIENEIRDKMTYFKGRVIAWDVINEVIHERDMFKYLPADEAVRWYKLAREIDPKAQLFMNEYAMLNNVTSPQFIRTYLDTVAKFRAKGAPIDALGIQGHVGRVPRSPASVISDLDLFLPTGLPVQITEFDINTTDEELQADYTRDFLIACYSHPIVTGLVVWGFWEPKQWKPDAAMLRTDWSEKPNAAVWRELVTKKWKTSFDGKTNDNGTIESRGHFGTYEVTVKTKNRVKKVTIHFDKLSSPVIVKLK
ncbi:MAG: hypothetical protein GZ091_02990 [Paludibacter sp.]|nr:hypothetical protein [Paludibacter sp.]